MMNKYRPMSQQSRQFFAEHARQMIRDHASGSPAANKAGVFLRYENTIRARDDIIKALVAALRPLSSLDISNYKPSASDRKPIYQRNYTYITLGDVRTAQAAIKEAVK